jgi:CRP-like cAMP-binding protein
MACDYVYILLNGTAKVYVENLERQDVIFAICGKGEIFGAMSAVDGLSPFANVMTLERSSVAWMEHAVFLEALHKIPALALNLSTSTMRQLRLSTQHIHSMAIHDVPGRVAQQLLAFAELYGEMTPEGEVLIPFRLTQSDMASLTGATRGSVNKALTSFRQCGYVNINQNFRISIRNVGGLQKCCQTNI